jgi:RyR domain
MPDPSSHKAKPASIQLKILFLLGLLAAVLVIAGLIVEPLQIDGHAAPWSERLDLFFAAFTTDAWLLDRNEGWLTTVGSLLARIVVLSTIILAVWTVFARQINAFRLARARDHVVVIGDTPALRELTAYLAAKRRKFIHIVEAERAVADDNSPTRVALPLRLTALEAPVALRHAKHIVLDTGTAADNMALARAIRQRFGEKTPPISCNIDSARLADEFSELLGVHRDIVIYDEARLAVRDTLARHPLYASADRQAAPQVHLLIIGFGHAGQILLEEAVQDSIAGTLDRPFVTVIDRQAEVLAATFARDKPQYALAADIAFIEFEVGDDFDDRLLAAETGAQHAALFARDEQAPVTSVALCLPSDDDNVIAALALRGLRRRAGRYFAPVFMRLREPEGAANVFFHADRDRIVDPFDSIVPIRLSQEALAIHILGEGERDQLARHIHARFRALSGDEQAANASWSALDETYRRANRHAADHVAAKLWSLDLATERHSTESSLAVDAEWQRNLAARESDLENIAQLEHRRWIADRVMEGWSYAERRDDDLRRHPDLRPFDELAVREQEKDRDQIKELRAFIKESARPEGRRFLPEFAVGLIVDPSIGAAEINAVREEFERRLLAPLAEMAPRHAVTLISTVHPGGEIAAAEAFAAALRLDDIDLRLVAIEGIPYSVLLQRTYQDAATREHLMHAGFAARRKLFAQFARVETVRIGPRGHSNDAIFRDPALVAEGARRERAYIARRADLLCVISKGRGKSAELAELVAFWTAKTKIPPEIDPGPSRRWSSRPKFSAERLIEIAL